MNGKGGTGKTTVAALLVRYLAAKKEKAVLAIDADPNSCLAELLGIREPRTIVGMIDEISKRMSEIPQGVTKDRFIEMKVHEEGLTEGDDFDLLAMGRPEGPGCYCYVNNLLRGIISKITRAYRFVIIDNAAGMEHVSRRTERSIDKLVMVSDYSAFGVRSAKKIYDLAREMGIRFGGAYLVMNKATGKLGALEAEAEKTGLNLAGTIPYEEELAALSIETRPIFELKSASVINATANLFQNLMKD